MSPALSAGFSARDVCRVYYYYYSFLLVRPLRQLMPPGRRRLSHGSGSNRQGSSITSPLLSSAPGLGPRPPLSKGDAPGVHQGARVS